MQDRQTTSAGVAQLTRPTDRTATRSNHRGGSTGSNPVRYLYVESSLTRYSAVDVSDMRCSTNNAHRADIKHPGKHDARTSRREESREFEFSSFVLDICLSVGPPVARPFPRSRVRARPSASKVSYEVRSSWCLTFHILPSLLFPESMSKLLQKRGGCD